MADGDAKGEDETGEATATAKPRPERKRRSSGPRVRGTVKWFNDDKGYGFISPITGADVFVHWGGIEGSGHRTLEEGQEVEFQVERGDRGEYAVGVRVVKPVE